MVRRSDTLRMFKHPLSLFVSFGLCAMNPLYAILHVRTLYVFIECFLLQWEVCSHCLYWKRLKVRSVDVPKYTLLCSLMQHDTEHHVVWY